jgi:hypothetical protein
MMQDPNAAAAIDALRRELTQLKERVANIEDHPALSIPPLPQKVEGCTICGHPTHWESQCPNNR